MNPLDVPPRFGVRTVISGTITVVAGLLIWYYGLQPLLEHKELSAQIRRDIDSLADRRSLEFTRGEWEYIVGWTGHLHANCGSMITSVDLAGMKVFAPNLRERLRGNVDATTIDWIWDEYMKFTKLGSSYSAEYRPTDSARYKGAEIGCFGIRVK